MTAPNPDPSTERTILLVDDDDDIREIVAEVLSSRGYNMLVACNGREALAVLDSTPHTPRLILLDLMMPDMDGQQFLDVQRLHPKHASIPVVVLTAAGRGPFKTDGPEIAAWLSKPVELDRLVATAARFAGGSPGTDRSGSSGSASSTDLGATVNRARQFLERRRREIRTLLDALGMGDHEEIRRIGHNLKGVGAGFGFAELGDLGGRLESAARADDEPAMRTIITELSRYLDRTEPEQARVPND